MPMISTAILLIVVTGLAGCTYRGPAENYFAQRLTFLSYLNGDDIRADCEPGTRNRYRFVYVADHDRQTRGYDLIPTADGARLVQMVDRGLLVNGLRLDRLLQTGTPMRATTDLASEDVAELEAAMLASGVFLPPPVGLRLESERFFWIVTGCYQGDYFLTGYRHPSPRFDTIRFDQVLFAKDRLDAPILRPSDRAVRAPVRPCTARLREGHACFSVEVGDDGLLGAWTID